ncbi:YbeD family protein [Alkalilimnicola sp. S0819]|uniref:YbeD family protein n=1 Tax=Alkalilimnicola sp. S0819 TaxID=2613922 RepID=UPI0012616F42|nr:DUF493 domain-containing protein [Alkalilimnicola sp. S0819]KAB7623765.1 DUF493 domain-containing protein [Alkalilimnicola sp. S0819]MPQ16637.1 DUF493 family protein [Alkalilimnicola sp. S0819]
MSEEQSLLQFPCDFPIKVMGRADGDLPATVESIARRHAPDLGDDCLRTQASKRGNYLSVTVTIRATSREQLDALYLELNAHEAVLMTL